jgi:hypothetical protein
MNRPPFAQLLSRRNVLTSLAAIPAVALLAACSDSGKEAKAPEAKPAEPATPAKPETKAATAPESQGTVDMTELLKPGPLPEMALGEENAKVQIIEYMSMTCPHCAHFHNTTFDTIKTKYIDTGKVRFILREFPFDPVATAAFMLARCSPHEIHAASRRRLQILRRTQAEFLIEPGLTGVVGPNGCGKSNLVEALRWVMGENSYKNMRASGMDDVIFAGSGKRPARNTAEVTLVSRQFTTAPRLPPSMMRRDPGDAPHRARAGLRLPHQRQGSRAKDVQLLFADASTGARSPVHGRAGPHRRADLGQAAGPPPAARRGSRHFRPAFAPPRGRASPARRRKNLERLDDVVASSKARSRA